MSTYLYSGSLPILRRMKIIPERRMRGPMRPNDRLMPPNMCTGGNRLSCMATGTTTPSM
ncbi:Uncharacterised protein [Mycobacterium tuberculosis]|uniref:Uncharacterized protein n=1 Tax=Mycobacterium tuberculosis TaxID=1773 RepID=A0A916LAY4_MYCTX|nr:Uncharacterised protein [Mycobacterium tuberculosis]COW99384.1 Uncharacterised protein [Mycobacterium tuberculosis]COX24243.1 Uncharacterised protein [Mycobacterium tuberculosis]COX33066.1 Uncharacterised protein [Mycobacterium tuberculosis]COY10817.1 Uncharacterised protein [Mycobacterium tuberculosis]